MRQRKKSSRTILMPKMSESIWYIYFSAVLAYNWFPIQGENVTCHYNDSVPVGGECYRRNDTKVSWAEAMDNCKSWKGKLATFTSVDQMGDVLTALENMIYTYFWVGSQDKAVEVGSQWAAQLTAEGMDFHVYSKGCNKFVYGSLCVETYNNMEVNGQTLITTTKATKEVILSVKCLNKDSVSVDGQCYRESSDWLPWSDAKEYCNSWNATVASFSSVNQGISILTSMSTPSMRKWVSDSVNEDNGLYVSNDNFEDCKLYEYGKYLKTIEGSPLGMVLCVELPQLTTTPEKATSLESTTRPELTNETKSSITPKSTIMPELNAPQLSQNKLLNQNQHNQDGLVEKNRQHYKDQLVFNFYMLIDYFTEID